MKRLLLLAIFQLLLALSASTASAQGYRGVLPLRSTRADVERVLGAPDASCDCYADLRETIRITYSAGSDTSWGPGLWDVPEDTVLGVEVEYEHPVRVRAFPVRITSFDEWHGSCIPTTTYENEADGVSYEVQDRRVFRVTYGPTAEDRKQHCSSPGDYVPGRPRQVHYQGSPPVCAGISADRAGIAAGESIVLMANASDPSGNVLGYTWTTTGGAIVGSGSSATFDASGLDPGEYTVTAQIDDGLGHTVECSITIAVRQPVAATGGASPPIAPERAPAADRNERGPIHERH